MALLCLLRGTAQAFLDPRVRPSAETKLMKPVSIFFSRDDPHAANVLGSNEHEALVLLLKVTKNNYSELNLRAEQNQMQVIDICCYFVVKQSILNPAQFD